MNRRQFIRGSAIIGATIAIPHFLKSSSGLTGSKRERKVYRVLNTDKTMVGTLPVLRAFAGDHNDHVSPFVFFDEFGPVNVAPQDRPLRVDAHPHAGIIPTTYFLNGSGHHRDSLNYDFQINRGDFMLFTSGRGAIHMEETGQQLFEKGGVYHGFQIWLNLPAKYKWIDPSTVVYSPGKMGNIKTSAYSAQVVLGELNGIRSQVETLFPVFYYHIKLNRNSKMSISTDPLHNAFVYLINGDIETGDNRGIKSNQVVLYERGESDISLYSQEGAEMLVCGGQPHNEPVYAYGPFVMNNEQEIRKCFADYNAGRMGSVDMVNNRK